MVRALVIVLVSVISVAGVFGGMRHKVKHVHFVGGGGATMSREQGPIAVAMGWDRLRLAPAADCDEVIQEL